MNNRSALDLSKETNLVIELVNPVIPANIYTLKETKLTNTKVVMLNLLKYGERHFQLQYFDDIAVTTRAVVVPQDFMFKVLPETETKKLLAKYQEYIINHLSNHLTYFGMIGSDPEIFIEDHKGEIIPAFNFLGSKEAPSPTADQTTAYWDGFQAEFTTKAETCLDAHVKSIKYGLKTVYGLAKKHNPEARFSTKTVFKLPIDLVKSSNPEHVAFGCMKSLNVYDMKGLEAPGSEVFYRTTGGHIHFGFGNKKSHEQIKSMVKALDAILSVACVSLFAKFDNPMRRQMYGLAGEYRLPPHGLEYRTLSNAWLFHPLMTHIVFDLARSTAVFGEKGLLSYWKASEAETIEVVNTCNVDAAREILKRNEALFKKIIGARYGTDNNRTNFVYDVIINGMDSIVAEPENLIKNWNLDSKYFPGWDAQNFIGKRVAYCINQKPDPNGPVVPRLTKV